MSAQPVMGNPDASQSTSLSERFPAFQWESKAASRAELRAFHGFARWEERYGAIGFQWLDYHAEHRACFGHLHLGQQTAGAWEFELPGTLLDVRTEPRIGFLAAFERDSRRYTFWSPLAERRGDFDPQGRLGETTGSGSLQWRFHDRLRLLVPPGEASSGNALLSYLVIEDPDGDYFTEISTHDLVQQTRCLKSSWFDAAGPAQIWAYLIRGSVYDPRQHRGIDRRFKCQQCAFAWWSYFQWLHRLTGHRIYRLLGDEVASTALLDQEPDGSWRHGFWRAEMEVHSRFFLDGIHLLLSQHQAVGVDLWLEAAARGMNWFLSHLTEPLSEGACWFLHDSAEAHQRHHFSSTAFGKSVGNTLCLNTHVQALLVLDRLARRLPEAGFSDAFERGFRAVERVLTHQPGGRFYDLWMGSGLDALLKPGATTGLSRYGAALHRRLISRSYWKFRARFPRLVQPNGLIERDLTLSFVSDRYHIINLKDLLHLYHVRRLPWLAECIRRGVEFTRGLDLTRALRHSPYYVEWIDVLLLYDRLIEPVPDEELAGAEDAIREVRGGYSLDAKAALIPGEGDRF
jgi:hypothetical protein